jgi:hypothetical protein
MMRARALSLVAAATGLGLGIAAVAAVPQVKTREEWRKTMHHTPAPQVGCFHASYPFGGASAGIVFMESSATLGAPTCAYLEHPYAWLAPVVSLVLSN